eukprot:447989_1
MTSLSWCDKTFFAGCTYDGKDEFCCNYFAGINEASPESLYFIIKLVRDLTIGALVCDWVMAVCGLCGTIFGPNWWTSAGITICASFVDVCLTFAVIGVIDQNNLVQAMDDLYQYQCYSEDHTEESLLELREGFKTIIILDATEASLDIISFCVIAISEAADSKVGIIVHWILYVFDIIIITVNIAVFTIPAYNSFSDIYDGNYFCYDTSSYSVPQLTDPSKGYVTMKIYDSYCTSNYDSTEVTYNLGVCEEGAVFTDCSDSSVTFKEYSDISCQNLLSTETRNDKEISGSNCYEILNCNSAYRKRIGINGYLFAILFTS